MSKMIGIRVPHNSNLSDRLKRIGFRLRMSHGELLEKWVTEEESRKGALDPDDNGELRAEIEALSLRIKILEDRAEASAPDQTQAHQSPKKTLSRAKGNTKKTSAPPEKSDATKRILELAAEGLTMRKIAERLTAEGIPTIKGGEKWNNSVVSRIIKRMKASNK